MSDDTRPPLTHAERGRMGGKSQRPTKGFGSPAVIAKALATRRSNAAAKLAATSVEPLQEAPAEVLTPYQPKPFASALSAPNDDIQVFE